MSTIKADYHIEGMSCRHCIDAVEGELKQIDGLAVEEVAIGRARVRYEANDVTPSDIEAAIDEAGYSVQSVEQIA
ncbi:MAG: cation transporter [Rhodothermales bacterium]